MANVDEIPLSRFKQWSSVSRTHDSEVSVQIGFYFVNRFLTSLQQKLVQHQIYDHSNLCLTSVFVFCYSSNKQIEYIACENFNRLAIAALDMQPGERIDGQSRALLIGFRFTFFAWDFKEGPNFQKLSLLNIENILVPFYQAYLVSKIEQ